MLKVEEKMSFIPTKPHLSPNQDLCDGASHFWHGEVLNTSGEEYKYEWGGYKYEWGGYKYQRGYKYEWKSETGKKDYFVGHCLKMRGVGLSHLFYP